ncbi:MAG: SAM-dependent chlorinase/fluorinase, partial [Actinomycetota bacterium]|nr:SAM-dependent chlorinase/fluorinase [Actinomycetota bacterium]
GPDNGLLLPAAEALGGVVRAVHLSNERYHLRPVSPAVHGRDIFSPVAAYLATGSIDLNDLGEEIDPSTMVSIDFPTSWREPDGTLVTRIIHINRFGNARLSGMQEDLDLQYGAPVRVHIGDETMNATYERTFGGAKEGDLILVADSHWRLSLAVNQGSAARALMLEVGDEVRIESAEEPLSC